MALAPEFVRPQDGAHKPDGELAAAKRWLAANDADYGQLRTTVLGDDRYCHAPCCRPLRSFGLGFVLVCKPASHATVYEWVADVERRGAVHTVVHRRWTGKRHETDTYRYTSAIPLCDADEALAVNWCELTTTDTHGKILYRNAFATTCALTANTVVAVVAAAG